MLEDCALFCLPFLKTHIYWKRVERDSKDKTHTPSHIDPHIVNIK